mgnify:CR=1 FL=1
MSINKNSKLIIFNVINYLIPISIFAFLTFQYNLISSVLLKNLICIFGFIFSILSSVFFSKGMQYYKLFLVLNILGFISLLIYYFGLKYDAFKFLSSPTEIKNLILSTGSLGVLVFIFIQISQVVCVPIPSVIIVLVGTLIYGPALCALFCSIGVLLGSYLAFGIGKTFGKKFVSWIIGKNKLEHFIRLLSGKEKLFLTIAFIFPFFPDDVLCMVAGVSSLTFKEFFKVSTLTRPIGVIFLCYLGGGFFSGLKDNLFVMILLITLAVIAGIVLLIVLKKRKKSLLQEIKVLIKSFRVKQ